MSCNNCDTIQDSGQLIAYYRWHRANVGMMGCDEHLREVFNALNDAQAEKTEKTMIQELLQLYTRYLADSVQERTHLMTNLDTGVPEPTLFKGDFDGFMKWLDKHKPS